MLRALSVVAVVVFVSSAGAGAALATAHKTRIAHLEHAVTTGQLHVEGDLRSDSKKCISERDVFLYKGSNTGSSYHLFVASGPTGHFSMDLADPGPDTYHLTVNKVGRCRGASVSFTSPF